ncbi:MAG: hypothetical protein HQL97_01280 [Magnetococcales bacterium]|nr:hypothetical protein [Magnetococcales bacterium]
MAISASGSKFYIGTSTGSANTITAVSLTNPCRITLQSSVAGYSVGDVVAIAGITGTTQLNGNSYVIEYIEPVSKIITLAGVDATGFTEWTSGGSATPVAFTQVKTPKTYSGLTRTRREIETTDLDSTTTEFIPDILESPTFSMEIDQDLTDTGQLAVHAALTSGVTKNFKMVLPNAKTATFSGFVKSIDTSGGSGQTVKDQVQIRSNSDITWA